MVQCVKNLLAMQETQEIRVQSLGCEDPLEEGLATHSSILAWRIPWTEEPGGLWSTGSQRVRHDLATEHACTHQGPYQEAASREALRDCDKEVREELGHIRVFIEKKKNVTKVLLLLLSRFSCVRLCATPIDGSPPSFPIPGILQARTLEWVAISFSNA